MNDTTVSPFHVCAGIAQMSNYRRYYFDSCFSTLWMRGRSCLFWCLQLILFSFAPISGSFVATVLAASLQFSLFLVLVVTVDGFRFRFVKSVYDLAYLRLLGPDLVNVRPVFSLFWIVWYWYQWSFLFTIVKIISVGDYQFSILQLTSILFPKWPILSSISTLSTISSISSILPTEARNAPEFTECQRIPKSKVSLEKKKDRHYHGR